MIVITLPRDTVRLVILFTKRKINPTNKLKIEAAIETAEIFITRILR